MIKTSIFTNTFFKICGFGRVDRLDDFLKCMLDISKWYGTDRYTHIDDMQNEDVVWHCEIIRVYTDMWAPWVHSTFAAWDESTDEWTAWIQYTLGAGGHCITDPHLLRRLTRAALAGPSAS